VAEPVALHNLPNIFRLSHLLPCFSVAHGKTHILVRRRSLTKRNILSQEMCIIRFGGEPEARKQLRKLAKDNEICVSAITEGEIRFGMVRKKLGQAKRDSIERVLVGLEVLPWDSEVSQTYGAELP
jgi:hypothetical protein